MKYNNLMLLSWQNLRRNRKRVMLSSLGMVIGIASLIFFFSLTNGARIFILDEVFSRLPANQVKLNPQYAGGISQGSDRIAQSKADTIAGLEGVRAVYGLRQIESTCYLHGFDVDSGPYTRLGISTFDTAYFADDLPDPSQWTWKEGDETIPMLINPTMLVSWNEIFSNTFGGTKLTMETISGVPLFLRVFSADNSQRRQFKVKIVGQSSKSPMFAPLVPIEFVRAMNLFAHGQDYQPRYSSLVVEMENPAMVSSFVDSVRKFDLAASSDQQVAGMIETGINALTIFLASISLLILFISLVNVFNIFLVNVMERKFEIGVMRAVGASRSDIRLVFLGESAFIGFVNGILGIALGAVAIALANPLFIPLTEQFFDTGDAFMHFDPLLMLIVLLLSPVVTVIAVFQPANFAASLDPVEALRK